MNNNKKNKYPPESAGRRMITNVPTALPGERILDIRKKLFEKAQEFETLNYIYIVDKEGKLAVLLFFISLLFSGQIYIGFVLSFSLFLIFCLQYFIKAILPGAIALLL